MGYSITNDDGDEVIFEKEIIAPMDWEHLVIDTAEVDEDIVEETIANFHDAGLEVLENDGYLEISRRRNGLSDLFVEEGVIPSLLNDGFRAVEFYDQNGELIREHANRARSAA